MISGNEFIGHMDDLPYKGYVIGGHYWTDGPIFRVYSNGGHGDDFVYIEYEGTSVEDCKRWVDGVVA